MSYGHARMFFATAAEAERYLENCRKAGNYTAENYQDRVSAQRTVRYFAGTLSPPPLPAPKTADIPLKKKPSRRNQTR